MVSFRLSDSQVTVSGETPTASLARQVSLLGISGLTTGPRELRQSLADSQRLRSWRCLPEGTGRTKVGLWLCSMVQRRVRHVRDSLVLIGTSVSGRRSLAFRVLLPEKTPLS